jgi:hypothetical protein
VPDLAELAGAHDLTGTDDSGVEPQALADHERVGVGSRGDDAVAARRRDGHRLLQQDALAGLKRGDRHILVEVVGHADDHGVDLRQQVRVVAVRRHAELRVGPTAVVLRDVGDADQLGLAHAEQSPRVEFALHAHADHADLQRFHV